LTTQQQDHQEGTPTLGRFHHAMIREGNDLSGHRFAKLESNSLDLSIVKDNSTSCIRFSRKYKPKQTVEVKGGPL
jgi:hypothetical protein